MAALLAAVRACLQAAAPRLHRVGRGHVKVVARDDGSVGVTVRLTTTDADSLAQAERDARRLVADGLAAAGMTVRRDDGLVVVTGLATQERAA
jgi:hypothetical protein